MISKPNRYFHHFHKIVGAEILYYQIEKPRVPCKRKEPDGPTYSSNGAFRDFFFFLSTRHETASLVFYYLIEDHQIHRWCLLGFKIFGR